VTLGPSSFGKERQLVEAGATAFRINTSHLRPDQVRAAVAQAQRAAPGVRVTLDLQGAKMRTGQVRPRSVRAEERVLFGLDGSGDDIVVPHPELFATVRPGDTLSLDDDRLRFEVLRVNAGQIEAIALIGGQLRPRRGVNVVEHPVLLEDLTDADVRILEAVEDMDGLDTAVSFVADGREISWVRRRKSNCRVIAKIERKEAVDQLPAIARCADGLWICRGDLGAQIGLIELARFISQLEPERFRVPVLLAGQVFEHLTYHTDPTRSEVCHYADLIGRGHAGIVLSDETAIGRDPIGAVTWAARLASGLNAPTRV
jgi:pyruvate kinase